MKIKVGGGIVIAAVRFPRRGYRGKVALFPIPVASSWSTGCRGKGEQPRSLVAGPWNAAQAA